jgi:Matrixin
MKTRTAMTTFAALGLTATAFSFVLLSPPRKWHDSSLPRNFTICTAVGENSLSLAEVTATNQNGVSAWNTGVGSTKFTTNVSSSTGNVGFVNNGTSTISFEDPQNQLSNGVLAATTTGWYTTSATQSTNGTNFYKFTDSDLVYNNGVEFTSLAEADAQGDNGTQYDMLAIAVHEVGHAIGLDHTPTEPGTMYASIGSHDWRKATLHSDDINGARHCYVQGYTPATTPTGSQLIANPAHLSLSTATFKANSYIYVRVQVTDENGNAISAASVSISVTRPDGTVGVGTASTNSIGSVTFNTGKAQHGNYSTSVTNITKAGMSFNSGAGKSSDTATY